MKSKLLLFLLCFLAAFAAYSQTKIVQDDPERLSIIGRKNDKARQAAVADNCGGLTVATSYNSNNGSRGNMFDITATNTVTISCFDANLYSGTATYEIYYKVGSYKGSEQTANDWTFIGRADAVTSLGIGEPTPIPIPVNVVIPAGQTVGFYVTNTSNGGMNYITSAADGVVVGSDANMTITGGVGKAYPFTTTYSYRLPCITAHYTTGPVTITNFAASPNPVCVGSPTTLSATIGNVTGSYNYTLTNGSSTTSGTSSATTFTQAFTATTSGTQTFTLTASNGVSTTATTTLNVNPEPTPSLIASNGGTLTCGLTSLTLTAGGGSSYFFKGPGESTSGIVSQNGATGKAIANTSGLYSVTVTNASTGCFSTTTTTVTSNTATVTVTNPTTTTGTTGTAFSQTFTASGGATPRSFSLVSGSLPNGLTLTTSGVLQGTPAESGSFSIIVRATDANGCSGVGATYTLVVSPAQVPCGSVVYVTQNGAGSQNGSSWDNAFAGTSLQTAINMAATCGAQVWVAKGVYKPTTTTNTAISFVLKEGVAIYGGFAGNESQLSQRPEVNPVTGSPSSATLSGDIGELNNMNDNSGTVVVSEPGITASAVLDGFVITQGNYNNITATTKSSGISNIDASPTIRNCFLIRNDWRMIFNKNSRSLFVNCRLDGDSSNDPYIFYNESPCSLTITGGLFRNTYAGIHNEGTSSGGVSLLIRSTTFEGNTENEAISSYEGGFLEMEDCVVKNHHAGTSAIYYQYGSVVLRRCHFINNATTDGDGGAIVMVAGNLNAIDCHFTGNSATNDGGAISAQSGGINTTFQLTNCVFEKNRSTNNNWSGGAVFTSSTTVSIINTRFVSNTASSGGGLVIRGPGNAQVINCAFVGNVATSQGGGLYGSTSLQTINSSFLGNQAPEGGAVYNNLGASQLVNSVFFDNGGNNTLKLNNGEGTTLSASYSLFEPSVTNYSDGGNNLTTTVSPFVSTTATQLRDCSAAINTGSNEAYNAANGPATDLVGNARQYNGSLIDRGAEEYQGASATLTVSNPTVGTATVGQAFSQSFTTQGGSGFYSYSVLSSNLPASLSLSANGVLSGTPTQAGNFSLTVQATDANGCSGVSATYTLVVIDPVPTAGVLVASPSVVCVGSPVTFTAAIGNVTGSYNYTLSNGNSPLTGTTSGNFSQSLTASGSGMQTFTLAVASNGQSTFTTGTVTVNAIPAATLSANFGGTLTCAQSSLTLTATGGASYAFAGPGVLSQNASSGTALVDASGLYSVTATTSGCSSVTTLTISQDTDLPTVSIGASTTTLTCANPGATLTADGTGRYVWSTSATSQTISVSSAGIYSVTLTADNGCTASASVSVAADQATPPLSITASQTMLTCNSPTASLTALGSGTTRWSTGSTDAQITVSTAGTYSVTLTAPGGCTAATSITIDQDVDLPSISISPSTGTPAGTTLTCADPSVTLTANGTGNYLWSTGATSQTISATSAGIYSVTLTADNGCTNTASLSVSADQTAPSLSISPSSATLTCANPGATLTALGTGSFRWSTGSTEPQIQVSTAGTYSVTLTTPGGCTATTSVLIQQDNTPPTVSISPISATLTCANPSATLTANGTGTYQWNTGATSQTITASSAGTYSVTLTTDNGCQATASSTIEQGADQTISFSQQPASTFSVTVGSTVTTQVMVSGQPTSFQWYKDNLSQPLASQTAAQLTLTNVLLSDAGSYFVVVTGPCNSLTSTAFTLSVTNPVTSLSLTASVSPNPIQAGQVVTLTANASGGTSPYSYSFSGPGSINPTGNTATVSGLSAGVYSFTVKASDATQPTPQQATSIVSLTVTAVETAPFAITGVTTVSCSPITPNRFSVSFNPRYSGLSGQPVSFSVANELLPTSQPGPYTIQLYTDNPTITLQARQQGTTTSFGYNWLEACRTSESPNTPPRVVSGLPNQTAKVGDYFTYVIPEGTFTDSETPLSLQLSANRLPAGLSFSGATVSGTPSTTVGSPFTVSITATDPGGLSVSTPLVITVLPATGPVEPTAPFAITGVTTISCTPIANRINISFAPLYSGLNGQPIAFEVVNERAPTTDPAPYSLTLYRDNPVITLRARQTGSAQVASFSYNWLAACSTAGQDNTPPRLNSPVASQTATVGKSFNLNLANTFADKETPNQLNLSAQGLPAGLVLVGTAISGTPSVSGVSTVILTATDGGGLSNTTSFELTVSPASSTTVTPPTGFAITGVQTLSCVAVSGGLRSVTFQPQYAGVTGQVISFRVENELAATTVSGPYTLNLYTDNPAITLKAQQAGSSGEVSYRYNWLAACSAPARVGIGEPEHGLEVTVLGNPVEGEFVEIEIRGAARQLVSAELVDQQGKSVSQKVIEQASVLERLSLPVGTSRGLLLLSVQGGQQQHQQKIVVK